MEMLVSKREAAAIYAKASRKWYGPRARSVARSMICKLSNKGDLRGVKAWRLVDDELGRMERDHELIQRRCAQVLLVMPTQDR